MGPSLSSRRGLQKSYSFDNVTFAAGELTCDAKDVGEVQKHVAKLQAEMANDMAKLVFLPYCCPAHGMVIDVCLHMPTTTPHHLRKSHKVEPLF